MTEYKFFQTDLNTFCVCVCVCDLFYVRVRI
jgi:hypothetical protein